MTLQILDEGIAEVPHERDIALLLGVGLTTLHCWRRQFVIDGYSVDFCRRRDLHAANRFTSEESQWTLLTWNESELAVLPLGQILMLLAD